MRASKLIVSFATLCMAVSPVAGAPAESERAAETEPADSPARRPASAEDLDQYAERERAAEKLASYEGGRGRYIEATTLIIILLVVILVLIIL